MKRTDARSRRRGWAMAACMAAGLWLVAGGVAQPQPSEEKPARENGSRPRGWGERMPQLSDKQLDLVMELVGSSRPQLADRLKQLRESDPQEFRRQVQRVVFSERMGRLLFIQEADPQAFDMHVAEWRATAEVTRLADETREATSDAAVPLKKQLVAAVEQQYDSRLKVREHELVQIENRLKQLRAKLEESRNPEYRKKQIEEQVQKVLASPKKD